jgi:DNA polymerase
VVLGGRPVTLYPIYHPAAALYTRSMLAVLEEDFQRIPSILARMNAAEIRPAAPAAPPAPLPAPENPVQLGLF